MSINSFPCLSFQGLGSTLGLSAHFRTRRAPWADAPLSGQIVHEENGRKQKRNSDVGVAMDGLGQQDDEGGEKPIRLNGEASVVSSHGERGFFIISSAPLVKSLLMSLQIE